MENLKSNGYEVIALGELLIDFTSASSSSQPSFTANPGGAPCNVLAMLSRLGHRTAFVGKVGEDMFGTMLRQSLQEFSIDDQFLVMDPAAKTTLAFVQNDPDGDRSFSFYRNPGADELLRAEELPMEALKNTKIFHFGSLSLTHEPARTATRKAVIAAKSAGALISFDPNLRADLWKSLYTARKQILWGCALCDILKVSQEELEFLTGCREIAQGAALLRQACPGIRLLLVSRGKGGSVAFYGDTSVGCPTFLQIPTVDTTGAGDTFCGCCLHYVLEHGLDGLEGEQLACMLRFANAGASLVTAKKGAMRSMPSLEEIKELKDRDIGGIGYGDP